MEKRPKVNGANRERHAAWKCKVRLAIRDAARYGRPYLPLSPARPVSPMTRVPDSFRLTLFTSIGLHMLSEALLSISNGREQLRSALPRGLNRTCFLLPLRNLNQETRGIRSTSARPIPDIGPKQDYSAALAFKVRVDTLLPDSGPGSTT